MKTSRGAYVEFPDFKENTSVHERLAGAGRGKPALQRPEGVSIPPCEPRKGHCGSVGAKGRWCSPAKVEKGKTIKGLRKYMI